MDGEDDPFAFLAENDEVEEEQTPAAKPAEEAVIKKLDGTVDAKDNPEQAASAAATETPEEGKDTATKSAVATEAAGAEGEKDTQREERPKHKPRGHRGHRQ